MTKLRRIVAIVAALLIFGTAYLQAQEAPETPGDGADDEQVTLPLEKQAELSAAEMTAEAQRLVGNMQQQLDRLVELQKVARKQKDVIKLNCVNDKLLQLKQLLNIAESARINMREAIAQGDDTAEGSSARYHEYGKVVIASQQGDAVAGEAEACIGEELIFLGPTEVQADEPAIPDDPTDSVPDFELEPPGYASPIS